MRNLLKETELNNTVKERAYQKKMYGNCEVWRGGRSRV